MFLDKFWRNVVFGPDKVFAFGLMFAYFGEQLLWSDVLLKSEQLEDGGLLGMGEYFLKEGQGDFGHAVVDDFDVELFVDHDVFGLSKNTFYFDVSVEYFALGIEVNEGVGDLGEVEFHDVDFVLLEVLCAADVVVEGIEAALS
jgi:hypothetical protein